MTKSLGEVKLFTVRTTLKQACFIAIASAFVLTVLIAIGNQLLPGHLNNLAALGIIAFLASVLILPPLRLVYMGRKEFRNLGLEKVTMTEGNHFVALQDNLERRGYLAARGDNTFDVWLY